MVPAPIPEERRARLLDITKNWLNARRTEVGHPPLAADELVVSERIVFDNLPAELDAEIGERTEKGRSLTVTHGGERISCAIPPVVDEIETYLRDAETNV